MLLWRDKQHRRLCRIKGASKGSERRAKPFRRDCVFALVELKKKREKECSWGGGWGKRWCSPQCCDGVQAAGMESACCCQAAECKDSRKSKMLKAEASSQKETLHCMTASRANISLRWLQWNQSKNFPHYFLLRFFLFFLTLFKKWLLAFFFKNHSWTRTATGPVSWNIKTENCV